MNTRFKMRGNDKVVFTSDLLDFGAALVLKAIDFDGVLENADPDFAKSMVITDPAVSWVVVFQLDCGVTMVSNLLTKADAELFAAENNKALGRQKMFAFDYSEV